LRRPHRTVNLDARDAQGPRPRFAARPGHQLRLAKLDLICVAEIIERDVAAGHDPPFGIVMRRMIGRPDFLAVRGSLLPEDERLLAGQWLLVERSVHEVASVRRGRRTDVA
jgi:hypothetical protein